MKPLRGYAGLLMALAVVAGPAAAGENQDQGFVPLFNGRDLTGWVNVNCAPGTFYLKDNQIITTGKPTGYLRTARQYENFIADFEWMHVPPAPDAVGNSGFFVWADPIPAVGTGYTRGIEVQVLVNLTYRDKKTGAVSATSQGDLFSIWGATCIPDRPHPLGWARCLPSENHCKGAGQWNHYRVEANDGVLKLAVNGTVVSGLSHCNPRKGYLALESEGSECRFRNLMIKELPSTHPKPNEVADLARGHMSLYTGLDLSGWKAAANAKQHWQPRDTVLHYDGLGEAKDNALRTERQYGDGEFIVDFRFPEKGARPFTLLLRSDEGSKLTFTICHDNRTALDFRTGGHEWHQTSSCKALKPVGQWNRLVAKLRVADFDAKINGEPTTNALPLDILRRGAFGLIAEGPMDFANLFVRELK